MKDEKIYQKLGDYLTPYRGLLILSISCATISVAATLALPIFAGKAIDCMAASLLAGRPGASPSVDVDFVALIAVLRQMLVVLAAGALAQLVMGMLNTQISTTIVKHLRGEAFDALTRLPLSEIDSHSHGDLESRIIADADAVGDGLLIGFSQLFSGVLTIVGTICFLFYISPMIAPVVVVLTPFSMLVARFISTRSKKYFAQQAALRGSLTDFCTEHIDGVRLLRAFGATRSAKEAFEDTSDALNEASLKATFYSSLTNPGSRFVNNIIYMAVCLMGALYAVSGGISVGRLTSFLSYASGYAKPFNEITGVITELQNALVCAERLFALKEMKPEQETGEATLRKPRGDVEFANIAFSYDEETTLIENLSLSVKSGEHVAIVGPTGAGKTTMVNLLMRFYDPKWGSIRIDGQDAQHVTRESLREAFGMVLQETWLREGTVFENLVLGREDATRQEVEEAARQTRAHDFIRKLPQGYDTPLTSDGGALSQGQKQLLCIARIMLSLPPMLILDEATSSIDTRTEQ